MDRSHCHIKYILMVVHLADRVITGKGDTANSQLYLFIPYGEPSNPKIVG